MNDNDIADIADIIEDSLTWTVRRKVRAMDAQERQLREAAAMSGAMPGEVSIVCRFVWPRQPGGVSLVVDYA